MVLDTTPMATMNDDELRDRLGALAPAAGAVTLIAPEGLEALIGGVAWEVGRSYIVSASDGVVHYCGQTGPATPELQTIYDAAFAG